MSHFGKLRVIRNRQLPLYETKTFKKNRWDKFLQVYSNDPSRTAVN